MAKTSVENLKARFKRGMYPTEGDFANVFDSYVHKDDGIDINDVTAENGSKTLTTLLQEFKQEILQDAKDQETQYDDTELKGKVEANEGNISSLDGRVSTNENNISTLKDDLDTAEDFIAGHESRIQALEDRAEVPEGLTEFIEKVNSFLEDSDATDAAINKWKEIEEFLSGITDTETLTGLLADLKQEILGEIPEQKEYTAGDGIEISEDGVISVKEDENKLDCVKVIADLDASEAPTGTIAIYTGETNEKYTHGFVYEKKGEGVKIEAGAEKYYFDVPEFNQAAKTGKQVDLTDAPSKIASWPQHYHPQSYKDCKEYCGCIADEYISSSGVRFYASYTGVDKYYFAVLADWSGYHNNLYLNLIGTFDTSMTLGEGASWEALNVMNVIN